MTGTTQSQYVFKVDLFTALIPGILPSPTTASMEQKKIYIELMLLSFKLSNPEYGVIVEREEFGNVYYITFPEIEREKAIILIQQFPFMRPIGDDGKQLVLDAAIKHAEIAEWMRLN